MTQQYKSNWKIGVGCAIFLAVYIFITAWCESIMATIPRF